MRQRVLAGGEVVHRTGRLLNSFRAPACGAAGVALALFAPTPSLAQDCPSGQTGKTGFVVERTERQKTEVFHVDRDIVRTIMRYDGKTLLETTQFQGLFQLERIDQGRRTKFEPKTDLQSLFPLRRGRTASASFTSERSGRSGELQVQFAVQATDDMFIGPCKYQVLKLDHGESVGAEPPRHVSTDYYAPELKLVVAREYRERDGRTQLIKFDRIYPIRN